MYQATKRMSFRLCKMSWGNVPTRLGITWRMFCRKQDSSSLHKSISIPPLLLTVIMRNESTASVTVASKWINADMLISAGEILSNFTSFLKATRPASFRNSWSVFSYHHQSSILLYGLRNSLKTCTALTSTYLEHRTFIGHEPLRIPHSLWSREFSQCRSLINCYALKIFYRIPRSQSKNL